MVSVRVLGILLRPCMSLAHGKIRDYVLCFSLMKRLDRIGMELLIREAFPMERDWSGMELLFREQGSIEGGVRVRDTRSTYRTGAGRLGEGGRKSTIPYCEHFFSESEYKHMNE